MKKEEIYPNYSVYVQMGGQLKHPFRITQRTKVYELDAARVAASSIWNLYRGSYDVLILKYTGPYDCGIVRLINRKEKDGSTSEHIL